MICCTRGLKRGLLLGLFESSARASASSAIPRQQWIALGVPRRRYLLIPHRGSMNVSERLCRCGHGAASMLIVSPLRAVWPRTRA